MASWTDKKPEFNPYIAQKPVEAMVKVGMQKQAQYQQGYEKIQQSIDNVAGMDVVRPEDKAYLQSKMNELGSKLQYVAAGDFSNFQLSNSVAGMANNIVKDDKVLGAVSSTAAWKAGNTAKKAANEGGTGSPSNDYDFDVKAKAWFEGGEDATFNSTYTPYTDYKKNALALVKELTGNSKITEDHLAQDANGNLVISDAILREELGGISPEQITQALNAGMSPADRNQMHIDGRYQYAGATNESLIQSAQAGLRKDEASWRKQKKVFEAALTTTTSVPEQNKINAQIEEINNAIAGTTKRYSDIAKSVNDNPEFAKGRLAESNFMNNFAQAFSYSESSQTFEKSEFADMAMRRDIKNMDWKKHLQTMDQRDRHHRDDLLESAADRKNARDIAAAKDGDDVGGPGPGMPGAILINDAAPNMSTYTNTTETERVALEDQKLDFFDSQDQTYSTPQEMKEAERWLDLQKAAYDKGPLNVSSDVADYFDSIKGRARELESNQQTISEIETEVEIEFGDIYDAIPEEATGVQVITPQGTGSASSRDIVDFNEKISRYYENQARLTMPGVYDATEKTIIYNDKLAREELSPVEYEMYELTKKLDKGLELTENERHIADQMKLLRKTVNAPFAASFKKREEYRDDALEERLMSSQPRGYKMPTDKPGFRNDVANVLTNFNLIAAEPGAIAGMEDGWDPQLAAELAIDPKLKATLGVADATEYGPARYQMTVTGEAGQLTVPLTPEQNSALNGAKYDSSPAKKRRDGHMRQMKKRGGWTTGSTEGRTTRANSWLNPSDFPQSGNIGVSGNIKRSKNTGKLSLKLNLYDARAGKWRENVDFGGYFPEGNLDKMMAQVTDEAIYEILYGVYPTTNDLTEIYSNLDKPTKN